MERKRAAWIGDILWHYRRVAIWERVLSGRDDGVAAGGAFRWAGPDDAELLEQAGYSEADLTARFAAAARAAVAVADDTLRAVSWYVPASEVPRLHDWYRLDLPQNAVWNFELRIAPEQEERSVAAALLAFAHDGLRREGWRYVHYMADERMPDDMRAYAACGYVRIEELIFLCIAQRSFLWLGRKFARGRWFPGNELVLPAHRL